jgi:hypothetical protein
LRLTSKKLIFWGRSLIYKSKSRKWSRNRRFNFKLTAGCTVKFRFYLRAQSLNLLSQIMKSLKRQKKMVLKCQRGRRLPMFRIRIEIGRKKEAK